MSFHNFLSLILLSIIILFGCAPSQIQLTTENTPTPLADSTFDGVRVTFIHYEGFLITVGDKRILIDGIFKTHPRWVIEPILESQPPFDGIDLILATHHHSDHFDSELISQYLQSNPETIVISTKSSVEAILEFDPSLQSRLIAIELDRRESRKLILEGVEIEAIRLSHNRSNVLNLGFVISIDDVIFFHMGDMNPDSAKISDLLGYDLSEKQIDIAFVHHRLFSDEKYHGYITTGIQAEYIIPMHFSGKPPSDFESNLPNVSVLWEPYDAWVMP